MRRLVRVLGIALVLTLLALGAVLLFLNQILGYAAARGGSLALGTSTHVDSVRIRLFAGTLDLRGVRIDNPPGFDDPPFLSLDRGRIALELGSLRGDRIVLPHIEIEGVGVHLQRKGGRTNYTVILEHMAGHPGPGGEAEPAVQAQAGGGDFVIEKLRIADVNAHVALVPRTGGLTEFDVVVPTIELENLDARAQVGGLFGELTAIVVRAVLTAVLKSGADLPAAFTRDLAAGLNALPGPVGSVTGAIGRVGVTAVEQTENLLLGPGGAAAGAASKVRGLLGLGRDRGGE